jgi:hypothetical protein
MLPPHRRQLQPPHAAHSPSITAAHHEPRQGAQKVLRPARAALYTLISCHAPTTPLRLATRAHTSLGRSSGQFTSSSSAVVAGSAICALCGLWLEERLLFCRCFFGKTFDKKQRHVSLAKTRKRSKETDKREREDNA